jgi:hypothetical protein
LYLILQNRKEKHNTQWHKVKGKSEWMSEWLLFNPNSAVFQLYHGKNKLFF